MGRRDLAAALSAFLALAAVPTHAEEGVVHGKVQITDVLPDGTHAPRANLANAVIYVPDFSDPKPPPSTPVRMVQREKRFAPEVVAVVVGTTVDFVNDDPFLHNVFSTSRAAPRTNGNAFDLGKYRGHGKLSVFKETGVIDLYCDIHESMAANLLVLPNSAFAITGADGTFTLHGVPPGKHTVLAWVRGGKRSAAEITVGSGPTPEVSLSVETAPISAKHKNKYGQEYPAKPAGYQGGD